MSGENLEPSQEVINEVNEGANWLANWVTERYNLGYLSKSEYDKAMSRLKNTKVYFTDKGNGKVVEALRAGEIHLNEEVVSVWASKYDYLHKNDGAGNLTKEQKAIVFFEETMKDSNDSQLGFHVMEVNEPVVFINVKKQQEMFGKYVYCPSVASIAVHEMTHNLHLYQTEQDIQRICLFGDKYNPLSNKEIPIQKAETPVITPVIIADTSLSPSADLVAEGVSSENEIVEKSDTTSNFKPLREGLGKDKYLDDKQEIYARLMQLRYTYKLKPDEEFTEAQIEEIERRAIDARDKCIAGENPTKVDVDFLLVERYKKEYVKSFLNNTAESREDGKKELKMQRTLAEYMLAKAESKENNSVSEEDEKREENNQSLNIVDKFDNIRS